MPEYTPSTLRELFIDSEKHHKTHNAFYLKDSGGALYGVTYEEFKEDVKGLGTALLSLKKRKNIGIFMQNSYEWCCAFAAITCSGNVAVPIDIALPPQELFNILDFADIDIVFADEKSLTSLTEHQNRLSQFTVVALSQAPPAKALSYHKLKEKGRKLIFDGDIVFDCAKVFPEDTATIIFTSGTTGMVKGVELSHKNFCSDLSGVSEYIKINSSDISMSILPLNHTYELICFLTVIYCGGAMSFCEGLRTLKDDFAFYRPTVFVSVPLIIEKIDRKFHEDIKEKSGHSMTKLITKMSAMIPKSGRKKLFSDIHAFFGGRVRMIICGAAALKKETAFNFSCYDIPIIIGYGLTECSPIVICNTDSDPTIDSVGKPLPGVEVKIDGPDDKGIGEICVKGDIVMKSYYKDDEKTRSAVIDGFFHTGDLGFEDSQGNYHITGRLKNIILTRTGKNIYPEEIEYYLLSHSVIAECVVYSEGDILASEILPNTKEIEKILNKSPLSGDEIHKAVKQAVRAVNRALPSYKRIKKVSLTDAPFDKTSTHKIKRQS